MTTKVVKGILWKLTPNKKYWVSEYGNIYSARNCITLAQTVTDCGYVIQGCSIVGNTSLLHRIVYQTFVGEIPEGLQINHIDGNKLNNHITNLEAVTASQNVLHAFANGLNSPQYGEKNGMHVLKEWEVLEIYQLIRRGFTNSFIGDVYGIHDRYVSLIRHGKRWKYLFDREGMVGMKSLGNIKMPLAKAVYIYNMCLLTKEGQDSLGPKLGIDPSTVSRIRTGETWKDFRIFFGIPSKSEDWNNRREELSITI